MRQFCLVGSALMLSLTMMACGGSDPKPDNTPVENNTNNVAPAPQTKTVTMYNYRFNPNTLTVPAGTTVVFKNKDPERHNVNIKQLNVDQMVDPQGSFSYTFASAGAFTVVNRLASTPMKVTIVVQ